jgi:predicted phage tail protein
MGVSMQELARATGLTLYDEPGPFLAKQGTLLGFKRNFLFAVGLGSDNNGWGIMARFKSAPDAAALVNTLKSDPTMKKMYTLANINVTSANTVVWRFGQPMRMNIDQFAQAIDAMAAVLAQFAQGFEAGKCEAERCGTDITTLTLANGIPNLMCEGCKQKVTAEQERARQEYERRQPNVPKALMYGAGLAIVTGVVSALLMYWDISGDDRYSLKLFLLAPFGVAMAAAWGVKAGVRNVTYGACALAGLMALLGIYIQDAVFLSAYIAHIKNEAWNLQWLAWAAARVPTLRWWFSGGLAVADVAAVFLGGFACWGMRPKFNITFKNLPMPAVAKSTVAPADKAEELTVSTSV